MSEGTRMLTLGFIGTGNMGSALAAAAAKNEGNRLLLANRGREKAEALRVRIGGEVTDNCGAARADYLFLGVKPQMLPEVAAGLRETLDRRAMDTTVVSMAAVTSIARLKELLGEEVPVIRIMPNTPVAVGEGIILYCCSEEVSTDAEDRFLAAMSAAGRFVKIEERLMDAGACISGCGPAFVDLFIEALADGGVACGLPRALALELAAGTVSGSAKLMLDTGKHPAQLKDEVCSPGGTTIRGVRALEKGGLRSAVMEAVIAAYQK